jgi:hypothetical protein
MSIWTGPEASGRYSVVATHRLGGELGTLFEEPASSYAVSLLGCSLERADWGEGEMVE